MSANATEAADSRRARGLCSTASRSHRTHPRRPRPRHRSLRRRRLRHRRSSRPSSRRSVHAVPQAPAEPQAGAVEIAQDAHTRAGMPRQQGDQLGGAPHAPAARHARRAGLRPAPPGSRRGRPARRAPASRLRRHADRAGGEPLAQRGRASPRRSRKSSRPTPPALAASWDTCSQRQSRRRGVQGTRRGDARLPARRARRTRSTTRDQLREIMMAQDFQDLTGQVLEAHHRPREQPRDAAARRCSSRTAPIAPASAAGSARTGCNGPAIDSGAADGGRSVAEPGAGRRAARKPAASRRSQRNNRWMKCCRIS